MTICLRDVRLSLRSGYFHGNHQKSSVANPQSATPTNSIPHSEGFSANSVPSLVTYGIIARAQLLDHLASHTIAVPESAAVAASLYLSLYQSNAGYDDADE